MIANVDGLNTDFDALLSSPCYDENADSIQSDPTEQPLLKKSRKRLSQSQNDSNESTSDQNPLTPDRHIRLPGLPNLDEIRRCVEICYDEFRLALIFQPKKLMDRLKLPSDHRDFPHPSGKKGECMLATCSTNLALSFLMKQCCMSLLAWHMLLDHNCHLHQMKLIVNIVLLHMSTFVVQRKKV